MDPPTAPLPHSYEWGWAGVFLSDGVKVGSEVDCEEKGNGGGKMKDIKGKKRGVLFVVVPCWGHPQGTLGPD